MAMALITKKQKTIIWTTMRKSGIEEDEFREWLLREFGTRSTRELSERDASQVITHLKTYTGEMYTPRPRTWGITGPQMRNARRLASGLGWSDEKRLNGMITKMFDPKRRLEQLNKTEGTKLILALERMCGEVERGEKVYA